MIMIKLPSIALEIVGINNDDNIAIDDLDEDDITSFDVFGNNNDNDNDKNDINNIILNIFTYVIIV